MDNLTALSNKRRNAVLASSGQMTLGEMIAALTSVTDKSKRVVYDFCCFFPTSIDSWRGIYAELALNHKSHENGLAPIVANDFIDVLKKAVGSEFYGYKGGEYLMGATTPVWVANHGHVGSTAVLGIMETTHEVVIVTGYREPYKD